MTMEVMCAMRALLPSSPCSIVAGRLHHSGRRPVVLHRSEFSNRVSLKAAASVSDSSTSIFLPFLEEDELEDKVLSVEEEEEEEVDPIINFFKSRASITRDSAVESKLKLKKNRRTTWHLEIENGSKSEEPEVVGGENVNSVKTEAPESSSSFEEEGVVERILRLARCLPENTTLGEVLGPFEGQVGEKQSWEVLNLMGTEGLIVSCLYFYEWMGLQEPSLVTPRACTVLFPLLGRAGMGDKLMILFTNLPKTKRLRDVHVYNAAISGLLCSGRYKDALTVFEEMERNNVLPDNVTCSIMITVMRKNGSTAKEAWDFFEKMTRKGVDWGLEVMGALIKAFCDEGLVKEALIIQMEMEKKGIPSNAIIFNILMNAYSKSGHIEEAEGLFAEMKVKGLMPTPATFNTLMDAYSRRMQPEIIENLLVEMKDAGLEPNARSYTCLISAYGRQRKMSDLASDAFLRMKKMGIKPTSHSYTALIHAYSVSGWHEKAYAAFENMLREGLKPSIETYTALLDAFRRAGDSDMLMEIWKLMISNKVRGTRVTFNIILDGFAKQGHYKEARDVISEFGKIGLSPTLMTFNMLINAYARGGNHEKLPQILKEMEVLNIKPDSITYSTIIYAYVRVRDFRRAFLYHKQMVKSGQVPDRKSYEKLREILDVKAATKNRKDRSAILGIVNSKMGLLKSKKRSKDEFWKNRKRRDPIQSTLRNDD
ncbi:unnamed protein product [Rhodiola kirilowii]